MDITEIQKTLNKISCPTCQRTELDATLRCDLGSGECLATAVCQTCKTIYEVSSERQVLAEVEEKTGPLTCPHCGSSGVEVAFRCELSSRQCFYVAQCQKCKEPFST